MKTLHILIFLVGISFSGCTNFKGGMVDSCNNNKVEQESSENVQKQEKKSYEKQDLFVSIGLFSLLLVVFAFYHIIVVCKIEKRLNNLEKRVDDDERKIQHKFESLREQRSSSNRSDVSQKISSPKEPDNSIKQESPGLTEEKAVIIEFPMEKKSGKEYKYLAPSYQGKFNKLLDEPSGKTRFRCWMENDGWHFEFHGDLKNAIENYNATFDETCIVEGTHNGATQYEIKKSGTLDKDLRILTKSTIRLY